MHVVAAADRADFARAEEAGGGRSHEGVGDRLGVVARRPEHLSTAAVAGKEQSARGWAAKRSDLTAEDRPKP